MKTYDETVRTVFARIETSRKRQKQRSRWIAAAVPLAACLVLWLGLRQPAESKPQVPAASGQTATSTAKTESAENSICINAIGSISAAPEGDRIIVHAVDGMPEDNNMNICLLWEDYIPLDRDEMNAYYGTNVFPTVPDDLAEWEDQQYGIFQRIGTEEVYWDAIVLNYSNEDFTRSVSVEVMKDRIPLSCFDFFEGIEERSVINGTEVTLCLSSDGYYYAEFMYNGVGFFVIGEGLTQEEMVSALSSLLQ